MLKLTYKSEGNDDLTTICDTVEEAINIFRADAETLLHQGEYGWLNKYTIELRTIEHDTPTKDE